MEAIDKTSPRVHTLDADYCTTCCPAILQHIDVLSLGFSCKMIQEKYLYSLKSYHLSVLKNASVTTTSKCVHMLTIFCTQALPKQPSLWSV